MGDRVGIEGEGVGKVIDDLEGGTEDGIGTKEARMGGIGRGKGRVEEMNMIE